MDRKPHRVTMWVFVGGLVLGVILGVEAVSAVTDASRAGVSHAPWQHYAFLGYLAAFPALLSGSVLYDWRALRAHHRSAQSRAQR